MISFSVDFKIVIIGSDNKLAIAMINNIEELFDPNIKIDQRFKDTTLNLKERILKIVVSVNNELLFIDSEGVLNNLGDVDNFIQILIKQKDETFSIKKYLGEVAYSDFGVDVEQYHNFLFSYNGKTLKCYNM